LKRQAKANEGELNTLRAANAGDNEEEEKQRAANLAELRKQIKELEAVLAKCM
jgi:hypothetical protein